MADTKKARGFVGEYKTFIARGNVMDMAVGVIVGGAFGKITTSLVNDIIMPLISLLIGGISFENWKVVLKQADLDPATGAELSAAVSLNFGTFLATILDFLIIALAVFCMVKLINGFRDKAEALKKKEEEAAAVEAPPAPSNEEVLLTEIRDLLKRQAEK